MEESKHLELTFIGRTYMILLYVIATVFLLVILGGILNSTSDEPSQVHNLYFGLALWIAFIAGGLVYEMHRMALKHLGMRKRSVRILLPLIFLLIIGIPTILISDLRYHPLVRFIFSLLVIIAFFGIWKALSMAIRDRFRSVREREF